MQECQNDAILIISWNIATKMYRGMLPYETYAKETVNKSLNPFESEVDKPFTKGKFSTWFCTPH